jgi:hypothetical protein
MCSIPRTILHPHWQTSSTFCHLHPSNSTRLSQRLKAKRRRRALCSFLASNRHEILEDTHSLESSQVKSAHGAKQEAHAHCAFLSWFLGFFVSGTVIYVASCVVQTCWSSLVSLKYPLSPSFLAKSRPLYLLALPEVSSSVLNVPYTRSLERKTISQPPPSWIWETTTWEEWTWVVTIAALPA